MSEIGVDKSNRVDRYFDIAHALLRSHVEYRICSVYDLSPEAPGLFDIVFCGSLLVHLQNPLSARQYPTRYERNGDHRNSNGSRVVGVVIAYP